MGKLDKVLEVATPVAKEAAKGTAKLTGKGLMLAGKGIKEAGSKAVTNYKENKAEQIDNRFEELKQQYVDGIVFRSYNVESCFDEKKLNNLGLQKYAKPVSSLNISKLAKVIVDPENEVQYRIYGDYYADLKRYFAVFGQGMNKIGSVNEHKKILKLSENFYETIKHGNRTIGELNDLYRFRKSNYSIEHPGSVFDSRVVVKNPLCTMMEIERVRGQEFIAITDLHFVEECILIYTAIDLIRNPGPGAYDTGG